MTFNNPIIVAVAVVPIIENNLFLGLLGVRRNNNPCKGLVAFPGGYQNELELSKSAAIRELFEETSLVVNSDDVQFFDEAITDKNINLQFWLTPSITVSTFNTLIHCKTEVQELVVISNIADICFPTHQAIFNKYLKMHKNPK